MSSTRPNQQLPRFLQLLTLLAIHTVIREEVEATVVETNLGGEFDTTNVIHQPIATGITSIRLDHLAQLGPTVALKMLHGTRLKILHQKSLHFARLKILQ